MNENGNRAAPRLIGENEHHETEYECSGHPRARWLMIGIDVEKMAVFVDGDRILDTGAEGRIIHEMITLGHIVMKKNQGVSE